MEIDDKKYEYALSIAKQQTVRGDFLLKKNYFGEKETVWIS